MAAAHAHRDNGGGAPQETVFARSWAWVGLAFPPFAMFVAPAMLVGFLIEPAWPLEAVTYALSKEGGAFARHVNHRIVFAAVLLFHVTLCLGLLLLVWDRLRDLPRFLRHRAYVFMVLEALLFLAVTAFYWRDTQLYALSYTNIRDLLAMSCAFKDIVPCDPDLDLDSVVTKLSIFVYVPQLASMAVLIAAVAIVGAAVGHVQQLSAPDWRERLVGSVNSLQICFFSGSAVLVTSTIMAGLFFQFPANVLSSLGSEAGASASATVLSEYARALTLFWGTVYTLTLIATFAPAVVMLRGVIRRYEGSVGASPEFREWLAGKALASPLRLVTNFAAMLAPMLFGAMAGLLKQLPLFG